MFHNAVVWDPLKNTLRHFSGARSSLAITKDTGTLEFSSVTSGIASGEVSPTTGQVWAPPLHGTDADAGPEYESEQALSQGGDSRHQQLP
ncbi:unnamed protein product [Ectocarpus sp. 6 AP-2014]